MRPKRIQIFGKYYLMKFVPNLGKFVGHCDSPDSVQKEIRIKKGQTPKDEFDTTIHEVTHAADFTKSESWVNIFSRDLTEILWKLGYRKLSKQELKDWNNARPPKDDEI